MLSAYFMTQKYLSFSKITEMDPQTPGFLGWLINFTMSLCYIKHRIYDGRHDKPWPPKANTLNYISPEKIRRNCLSLHIYHLYIVEDCSF